MRRLTNYLFSGGTNDLACIAHRLSLYREDLGRRAWIRPQTAAGLERDLRCCLADWERQHRIDDFPLRQHDTPDRLLIREKLHGRAHELEALLGAFERVVSAAGP